MERHYIEPLHPHAGAIKCSELDYLCSWSFAGITLVYNERLDPQRLIAALRTVLSDFPEYASRMTATSEGMFLTPSPRSAVVELDEYAGPVRDLENATKNVSDESLYPKVSVMRARRGKDPLLAIRLTLAADGTAIAFRWFHLIGDLHGTILLLRAWMQAYRGVPHQKPVRVLDRDAYLAMHMADPPHAASALRLGSWRELSKQTPIILSRGQRIDLEYPNERIAAIQRAVSDSAEGFISTNDALCAHLFWCLQTCRKSAQTTNICLAVNYRKRAGLPEGLLGNLSSIVASPVHAGDKPAVIASGLRRELDVFASKHLSYHATRRVLDAHSAWSERTRLIPRDFQVGRGDVLFTNTASSGAYDIVFENERPSLFWPLESSPPWFSVVYQLPNDAGLGVGLFLPADLARVVNSKESRALLLEPRSVPGVASVPTSEHSRETTL